MPALQLHSSADGTLAAVQTPNSIEACDIAEQCSLSGGGLIVPPHAHLKPDSIRYKTKQIFESTQVQCILTESFIIV